MLVDLKSEGRTFGVARQYLLWGIFGHPNLYFTKASARLQRVLTDIIFEVCRKNISFMMRRV